jgi:purine-nucleoside phosphorylase
MFGAPTPHNEALPGEIAPTVLMPGDPLRAQFIAETYFENPVQFNGVRGMLGFTGTFNGKPVSAMGSGMGMPSIGIYAYELYNFYNVERIIRVGSAGGMSPDLKLYDIVIGMGACFESNFDKQYDLRFNFAPICSFNLLEKAVKAAREKDIPIRVGNIVTKDLFYSADFNLGDLTKLGVLACEMEAAALYMTAAWAKKEALCILTISDHILLKESTTALERQTSFTNMMDIALELA